MISMLYFAPVSPSALSLNHGGADVPGVVPVEQGEEEEIVSFNDAAEQVPIAGVEQAPSKREARPLSEPPTMTAAQQAIHNLTHQPPEDWCEYCRRGRALCRGHRRIREEDRMGSIPTASMDLAFLKRKNPYFTLPMLVMRENGRGETRSHGLRSKHVDVGSGSYAIGCIVADIGATGYKRLILKSDQEPVMRALQTQVKKRFDGEIIPRYSQVWAECIKWRGGKSYPRGGISVAYYVTCSGKQARVYITLGISGDVLAY